MRRRTAVDQPLVMISVLLLLGASPRRSVTELSLWLCFLILHVVLPFCASLIGEH